MKFYFFIIFISFVALIGGAVFLTQLSNAPPVEMIEKRILNL